MSSASALRLQIESTLARRIPSALTPAPKMIRALAATGIEPLDDMLGGGLPIGAISELVGPECSGRTSAAISFLARATQAAKVCAWIDVSNAFDPASAAASGVDLARLLWVRCGVSEMSTARPNHDFVLPDTYYVPPPAKKGLHGGGFGSHPRNEVRGLSDAVSGLLRPEAISPRYAELQRCARLVQKSFAPNPQPSSIVSRQTSRSSRPWSRIEQALRATDLLLQGGGFSAIVLDMGGLAPEFVSRVPLATWFRYRAAAERTQSSILLLTQHACAKSSAELVLRLHPAETLCDEATVFTGIRPSLEVARNRFAPSANVLPLRRPPQSLSAASWKNRTAWAGSR
ncbi:MAG TPA: recombinase RecA [Terracidiphilus sp.]